METTKTVAHTPAPWRMRELTHKDYSYLIDAGPEIGSYLIATINRGNGPDEANARLIAEAPTLLKEAAAFVADFEAYINSDDYDLPDPSELLASIARATGTA
jgi:hypothetical protein